MAGEICDDRGICLDFHTPATKIIPLYGAFNEILLALGAKEQISARTVADADIEELKELPEIGTHMRPNAELIIAHQPDVVLQMAGRKEASQQTDQLAKLGLKVLTFEINSFQQLFELTRKLGQLAGKEQQAAKLVQDWKARLANLPKTAAKPGVYFEVREPNLLAAGLNNIVTDMIEVAGGQNVVQAPKKLVRLNEEALLTANPEICLVQKGPMNPAPRSLNERPNLHDLPCVRNGKFFIVDEKMFSRPGPNSITAGEQLAQIISGTIQ